MSLQTRLAALESRRRALTGAGETVVHPRTWVDEPVNLEDHAHAGGHEWQRGEGEALADFRARARAAAARLGVAPVVWGPRPWMDMD